MSVTLCVQSASAYEINSRPYFSLDFVCYMPSVWRIHFIYSNILQGSSIWKDKLHVPARKTDIRKIKGFKIKAKSNKSYNVLIDYFHCFHRNMGCARTILSILQLNSSLKPSICPWKFYILVLWYNEWFHVSSTNREGMHAVSRGTYTMQPKSWQHQQECGAF